MELRQLEHFIAVAEERSFTRAAKRMNIVQSGLSMSIRALESELGTRLFERRARDVALTEAGSAMLPEARRAVAAVHAVRDAVAATQRLLRGTLAVGIAQYVDGDRLPNLLARFHAEHPGVALQATQARPAELIADVDAGHLDLAICGRPADVPESVTTLELGRAPFVLMCAEDHPLARSSRATLADVADEPFIELGPGWATRDYTDRAFEAARLTRRVVCELQDILLRVQMVAAGLGVAILPGVDIPGVTGVARVPLHPPLPDWRLVAAFKGPEPSNPAARVFLEMVACEWQRG